MRNQISKPVFVRGDKEAKKLLSQKKYIILIDAFERQLKELFFIENRQFIGANKEESFKTPTFKKFINKKEKSYNYIYYPWNHSLVKCVFEDDFLRLKTSRNQDLITAQEQNKLYHRKVAVFGLSVGSNIVYTLTQAGISKEIVIADFDTLDTTNLNRIQAGIHEIGQNKTIVCARRIYEENPYAIVETFENGIDTPLLKKLFKPKERIGCVVEEIDNIPLKIEVRKLARAYKVPVVMITDNGDEIVIHVERYDLGYKKIFEKDDTYWRKKIAAIHSMADVGDIIINDIVGGPEKVEPRMLASVPKVLNHKLVSWPQLGSAAILGGVAATLAIKNIFLGRDKKPFFRDHIHLL